MSGPMITRKVQCECGCGVMTERRIVKPARVDRVEIDIGYTRKDSERVAPDGEPPAARSEVHEWSHTASDFEGP